MKKEIFAIYFPSWHPDAHYESWYGKGFSEWKLLESTKPLFPGHLQPKKPLWGYFDESDPQWMEKQIDLAADFGITGFLFDWYWYNGVKFLEKPLEQAFLKASNRNRLKFSLMWANHNWGVWPALDDGNHQAMNGNENQSSRLFLEISHSLEDLRRVLEYSCKNYFCCENYWRIDNKPVYSIYDCNKLFEYVTPAQVRQLADDVAKEHGLPGIYLLMNIGCCNDNDYFCGWGRIPKMRDNGFDAVFAYNSGLHRNYAAVTAPDAPTMDFSYAMTNQRHCWKQIAAQKMPWFPSVTIGDDVSPRWNRKVTYPWDYEKLGYYPIMVNNTPERIAELLKDALAFDTPAVIINAWNEWSEGMYLIPDEYRGNAMLECIKEVVDGNLNS